jgi:hypothetical protein
LSFRLTRENYRTVQSSHELQADTRKLQNGTKFTWASGWHVKTTERYKVHMSFRLTRENYRTVQSSRELVRLATFETPVLSVCKMRSAYVYSGPCRRQGWLCPYDMRPLAGDRSSGRWRHLCRTPACWRTGVEDSAAHTSRSADSGSGRASNAFRPDTWSCRRSLREWGRAHAVTQTHSLSHDLRPPLLCTLTFTWPQTSDLHSCVDNMASGYRLTAVWL